jgi:predicted nucleic acid-binding protein
VDVQVILAAFRSRNGASNLIVRRMIEGEIAFAVSPAVALEYEEVLKRTDILGPDPWVTEVEIDIVLDAILAEATLASPRHRFRPFLDDPDDDIYVECALAAGASVIVTMDRHFQHPALAAFGISAWTPGKLAAELTRK